MANYWLFKTDPETFSIDDLARAPGRTTGWDGVRNAEARNLLRDRVGAGDLGFLYHSSSDPKAIVGIVEVVGGPRLEPGETKWFMVDLKLVRRLARPVTLDEVKRDRRLAKMALVTRGRLSVQPVTAAEWKVVLGLAGRAASAAT